MEWLSRMKLDLEAVVEDASDEVQSLEIQDYSKKILSCSTHVWVPAGKLSLPSSTVVTHSSIREVIVYAW